MYNISCFIADRISFPDYENGFDVPLVNSRGVCMGIEVLSGFWNAGELPLEENGNVVPTEEIIHKESSTYDELLKLLSTSSKSVALANKQR